jgi:hypothetical protein
MSSLILKKGLLPWHPWFLWPWFHPLMDYSQSDVVTFDEYLKILWIKTMEKEIVYQIQVNK